MNAARQAVGLVLEFYWAPFAALLLAAGAAAGRRAVRSRRRRRARHRAAGGTPGPPGEPPERAPAARLPFPQPVDPAARRAGGAAGAGDRVVSEGAVDVSGVRWQLRPLETWTGPETGNRRSSAVFRAKWPDTVELLCREVGMLGGSLVVVQLDVTAEQLRRDGQLRAGVGAAVDFPGVRVSFDSRHGPLTYATDAYDDPWDGDMPGWQANVRAVALGLQALRAVDRYGISSRGEQYRGWTAITAGSAAPPGPRMSVEEAARLLAGYLDGLDWQHLLGDRDTISRAFRAAARATSPDTGGDPERFARVLGARDWLYAAAANARGADAR